MAKSNWHTILSGLLGRVLRRVRIPGPPVNSVFDVPDHLPRNTGVVVRKGDADQWLAFDCPCRARHRVMLNLDQRAWPVWTVHESAPLTLVPSVDEKTEHGRCHYVIKKGKIRWV